MSIEHPDPYPLRSWQRDALPVLDKAVRSRVRAIVQASTGAGKTDVIAAYLKRYVLPSLKPGWVAVVAVPSQNLVEQTAERIDRWCGEGTASRVYASEKTVTRVVVCCFPSVRALADVLALSGERCALLIHDECHKPCEDVLNPVTRVGFTGTPFRSAAHERLEAWDVVAVRYGLPQALADKVIVPPRFVFPTVDEDDYAYALRVAREATGPGVVSAVTIKDAESVCDYLNENGVSTTVVHSKLSKAENAKRLEYLRTGFYKAVVNVGLLVEGVDLPWLRWGCIRREEKASVRAIQHLGRYLRHDGARAWGTSWLPAKTEAVIFDRCNSYGLRDLNPEAELGESEAVSLEERMCAEAVGEKEDLETPLTDTQVVGELTAWLLELRIHGQLYGASASTGPREGGITPAQVRALRRYGEQRWRGIRRLPKTVREALKALIKSPALESLTAAAASDLLMVAGAAADRERAMQQQFGYSFRFPGSSSTPEPPTRAVQALKPKRRKRAT